MGKWSIKQSVALPQEAADYLLRNLAFYGFIAALVVVYIYIVHHGEGRVREYQALKKEVKELRWEYLTMRSDLMVNSQQSALAKQVSGLEVAGAGSIPQIISKP